VHYHPRKRNANIAERRQAASGNTRFADPTNTKYPIDTQGRIKAAWVMARVRQQKRAEE
jgi:hypothetical protein